MIGATMTSAWGKSKGLGFKAVATTLKIFMNSTAQKDWDVFISHASEDKESFVRPLAVALRSLGVSVWYDEFSLRLGDSLSASIDKGLAGSKFGLVIVSQSFLSKQWPQYELRGLVHRDVYEGRVIIPIWHGVTREQMVAFSPSLADKVAIITAGSSAQDVSLKLLCELRPDLYEKHPRSQLERLANGEAIAELQQNIEDMEQELAAVHEELAEYRCTYCGAPESSRNAAPLDEEQRDWGTVQSFGCGHQTIDGFLQHPCPKDPRFPTFDDYELVFTRQDSPSSEWWCYAKPKTEMARMVSLGGAPGKTKEQAAARVRDQYDWEIRPQQWYR
jgi:hypothetical protein